MWISDGDFPFIAIIPVTFFMLRSHINAMVDLGVSRFPFENMHVVHLINKWMNGRYFTIRDGGSDSGCC